MSDELREALQAIIDLTNDRCGDHCRASCAFCGIRSIAATAMAAPPVERVEPYAYACPAKCGCIWRDNHDGSMSLFGKNSNSCEVCEPLPLDKLIPLFVSAQTSTATPLPANYEYDPRVEGVSSVISNREPASVTGKPSEAGQWDDVANKLVEPLRLAIAENVAKIKQVSSETAADSVGKAASRLLDELQWRITKALQAAATSKESEK